METRRTVFKKLGALLAVGLLPRPSESRSLVLLKETPEPMEDLHDLTTPLSNYPIGRSVFSTEAGTFCALESLPVSTDSKDWDVHILDSARYARQSDLELFRRKEVTTMAKKKGRKKRKNC